MEDQTETILSQQERAARRAQREQQRRAKLRRRRLRLFKRLAPCLLAIFVVAGVLAGRQVRGSRAGGAQSAAAQDAASQSAASAAPSEAGAEDPAAFAPEETAGTVRLGDEIVSQYAILVDLDSNTVLAEKNADTVMNPASMTKILTVLVAAEQLDDLDASVTISTDVTDFCYVHGCSVVGFSVGETVPVRDLFYGTVLPSGADAALALAIAAAGSQEAFVGLMNEKLGELGLSDTAHFTNCIGLYDENHVCTVRDMAAILAAALKNDWCREVLSAHTYTTAPTPEHPEGMTLSNWFLRRIEDKDCGNVSVLCAKTGYVAQSGSCAASCAAAADGSHACLCVTAKATSSWRCIYDHVALYKQFT